MTILSNIEQLQEKHDISTEQARFLLIAYYTTLDPKENDISSAMADFTADVCKWSKKKMSGFLIQIQALLNSLEKTKEPFQPNNPRY